MFPCSVCMTAHLFTPQTKWLCTEAEASEPQTHSTSCQVPHQFMGRLTPAASPEVQGAARAAIAVAAKCAATREEEQAVSMATAGPCRAANRISSFGVCRCTGART